MKLIRAIGEPQHRIAEDKLRMMRAVRFAVRFGFQIEPELAASIQRMADTLSEVSLERIQEELKGILKSRDPVRSLKFLWDLSLLRKLLPGVTSLSEPLWSHSAKTVGGLRGRSFDLLLAALLHDIGIEDEAPRPDHGPRGAKLAEEIGKPLRLSAGERKHVVSLIEKDDLFHRASRLSRAELVRLLDSPRVEDHITLQHADAQAGENGGQSERDYLERMCADLTLVLEAPPLVTGKMLLAMGLQPGKMIRKIVTTALDTQREGAFHTPEKAEEWVLNHVRQHEAIAEPEKDTFGVSVRQNRDHRRSVGGDPETGVPGELSRLFGSRDVAGALKEAHVSGRPARLLPGVYELA